ncbi:glycosyltransferase [Paludisphaera rhizosphaerae]|uniref:glycosyltransferase n=1 Tax=Paludisphaera rhizosphaerae TaxID=2711216 RepID=UPI00197F2F3A|nr:glycosyltransferase [Paludisphaera rhizosphaerae]
MTIPDLEPSFSQPRRIVLTALGSLGDLHPYIAIALGLRARGHEPVLATGETYRRKIEALGLEFRPLRPDSDELTDPNAMRRYMDSRRGTFRVLRNWILPAIRESYEDTLAAAEGADLLVAHPLAFTTRIVAEQRGLPWVSSHVSPVGFFSAVDPPVVPGFPGLAARLHGLGPWFWSPLSRLLWRVSLSWGRPIEQLRAEIGLPPSGDHPLVDGHSPGLALALFPQLFAPKQIDWPPQVVHTGFPFYDRDGQAGLPPELARFLDDGPPPIVFTLGVTSAMVAGSFFEDSLSAAKRLGRRAVLVVGKHHSPIHPTLSGAAIAVDYAPFSELFPRAAAVVHSGGIGTTGLAMRAGRPTLIVPHAHDQHDNAARAARLGIARVVVAQRYTAARAAVELHPLLDDPSFTHRASEVAQALRREDGVGTACDLLEGRIADH